MKKIPTIRMPDPKAGVIRSEHPRDVGMNGLVEAYNWVLRDGNVQVRDGIVPVETPSKTLIGDVWSQVVGEDIWYATISGPGAPSDVWVNGAIGTEVAVQGGLVSEGSWLFDQAEIYVYATSDPVTAYTTPGVEWATDDDDSSVIAMTSHDYQGADDTDTQGVVRDQLTVVTDSDVVCYNNDLTVRKVATATDVDWAWQGAIGPGTTPDQEFIVSPKISIDWSNIDWGQFTAGTHGVGISIRFTYFSPAGITVRMWEFTDSATTEYSVGDIGVQCVWDKPSGDDDIINASEYESGYPWQILTQAGTPANYGTGIYVIFTDTWDSWYDELTGQGGSPTDALFYHWAVYQAEESGLPGGNSIVDLDRTLRPVTRTWDYEQKTHVLIAAKDKYILDVDADSLATDPAPTVSVAGDAGVSPRARCLGIASQRIVAGNISYFDSALTADNADADNYINSGTYEWHSIVDAFAHFPDAVVYSGTVLTGGHTYWYPADILRLADTPGEIVASQEMGTQQIAIYKTDSIYTLTAQSGISPFAPSLRASGISGPVGPRAVVSLSDQTHLYLGRDGGIYMFSGGTPQSLGNQFRSWISREIDSNVYADDSFMQFDPERNEVHVYYPVKGSGGVVRKGMIIDVSKQPFTGWPVLWPKQVYDFLDSTLEDVNFICSAIHWEGGQESSTSDITIPASEVALVTRTKYQELYFGTENKPLEDPRTGVNAGRIFKTADVGNDHGVAISAMAESGISDLGDPDSQKVLLELELLFDNIADITGGDPTNLKVTVYGGDSNQSLSQVFSEDGIDMSSGQITVHPRVRARYFSYKVEVTAPVHDYDAQVVDWTTKFGEINFWGAIARYKKSGVRQN